MKAKGLALLLITSAVFAGTTATVVHNTSVFRPDGGTTLTIHDKDGKTALEQCMDMAKAAPGKSTCTDVYGITTTGTCDDVAKPQWPLEKDADGYVIKPPIRAKQLSDTDWQTEIQDYVPAPYPTCWVLGWRIIADADLNDETQTEAVNVMEPVPVSAEFQAWWDSPEAEAQRHLSGYCYDSDKTPCPVMPVIPSACGPYNGVGCGATG